MRHFPPSVHRTGGMLVVSGRDAMESFMDAAWPAPFVNWPGPESPVSLSTWWHEVVGFARARARGTRLPENAMRGHGEPVIVIPAFFPGVGRRRSCADFSPGRASKPNAGAAGSISDPREMRLSCSTGVCATLLQGTAARYRSWVSAWAARWRGRPPSAAPIASRGLLLSSAPSTCPSPRLSHLWRDWLRPCGTRARVGR